MLENSRVQFLGTGSSMGVPVIGCKCNVCSSCNPKNKRLRSSILLKVNDLRILVDATPDYREQALRYEIERLDGVILTHMHFDHIAGIDDLRIYNFREKRALPLLMHQTSYALFSSKYSYLFDQRDESKTQTAKFDCHVIEHDEGQTSFCGLEWTTFVYAQAYMEVMGFRLGNFAYLTDIREYPDSLFSHLEGVDTLVVSALRPTPSNVHFNIDEAVQFAQKVRAKRTFLIHMAHEIEHETISKQLPSGIELSFDGLEIDL